MSTAHVEVTDAIVTKTYTNPAACSRALAHYRFLQRLPRLFTVPELLEATATRLALRTVAGNVAAPSDLTGIADALGQLHCAAHDRHLRAVRLNTTAMVDGMPIPAFDDPHRRTRLMTRIGSGESTLMTPAAVNGLFAAAPTWPAAIYKDCNPRNFIVPESGPVALVDFDDLTLAPFGYDLAKLIVTTAMTYGELPTGLAAAALVAYNRPLAAEQRCPAARLAGLCEVHHLLTASYLGRNGYCHPWPDVRPWPSLEDPW